MSRRWVGTFLRALAVVAVVAATPGVGLAVLAAPASAQSELFSCEEWRHYKLKPPITLLPSWLGGWDSLPSDAVVEAWEDANPGAFPSWLIGSTASEGSGWMADCPVTMGGYVSAPATGTVNLGGEIAKRAGYSNLVRTSTGWKMFGSLTAMLLASDAATTPGVTMQLNTPSGTPQTISLRPYPDMTWEFEPNADGIGGKIAYTLGDIDFDTSNANARVRFFSNPCTPVNCYLQTAQLLAGTAEYLTGSTGIPTHQVLRLETKACGLENPAPRATTGSPYAREWNDGYGSPPWPACAGATGFAGPQIGHRPEYSASEKIGYYGPYFEGGNYWTQVRVQTVCAKVNSAGTGLTSYKLYLDSGVWTPLEDGLAYPPNGCRETGQMVTQKVIDVAIPGTNPTVTRVLDVSPAIHIGNPMTPCLALGNNCDVQLVQADGVTRVSVGGHIVPEAEAEAVLEGTARPLPQSVTTAVEEDDPTLHPGYPTTAPETTTTTTVGGPGDTGCSTPQCVEDPPAGDDGDSCWTNGWSWNPISWVYIPVKCALLWAFDPGDGFDEFKSHADAELGDWVALVGGLDDVLEPTTAAGVCVTIEEPICTHSIMEIEFGTPVATLFTVVWTAAAVWETIGFFVRMTEAT